MGIDCDCSTKSGNYRDCVHASTVSDKNFVRLVT